MSQIKVREYEILDDHLSSDSLTQCKEWINKHQDEDSKTKLPLRIHRGKVKAQNHVGIFSLRNGLQETIVEILPKISLNAGIEQEEKEKQIFFKMLRHWRHKNFIELDPSDIEKCKHYPMLEVFFYLFLTQTLQLIKRGIVSQYHTHTDNLPSLKGRLLFPQQAVINAANKARFYVQYDQYSPDHAANRLISKVLRELKCRESENARLQRQLRSYFDDIEPSKNKHQDWQQHRRTHANRTMQHYKQVMQWVELFLFGYGLTTYQGDHDNQSLLFPMQEIFEDFVAYHFRQSAKDKFIVKTQAPQKPMVINDEGKKFWMEPDITLCDKNTKQWLYILDSKWKRLDARQADKKYNISQQDLYQLYSYGKLYGCSKIALIYPQNENFEKEIEFIFNDVENSTKLTLSCYPFDVANPEKSADFILESIHPTKK